MLLVQTSNFATTFLREVWILVSHAIVRDTKYGTRKLTCSLSFSCSSFSIISRFSAACCNRTRICSSNCLVLSSLVCLTDLMCSSFNDTGNSWNHSITQEMKVWTYMEAEFLLKLFNNFVAFLIGRSQFFVDLLANILQLGLVGQPHFLDLLQLKFAKQKHKINKAKDTSHTTRTRWQVDNLRDPSALFSGCSCVLRDFL